MLCALEGEEGLMLYYALVFFIIAIVAVLACVQAGMTFRRRSMAT